MKLCCDGLYASILPYKCAACKAGPGPSPPPGPGAAPPPSSSPPTTTTTTTARAKGRTARTLEDVTEGGDADSAKKFDAMAYALEAVLLHGLLWGRTPTYGTSQAARSAAGFLAVLCLLSEEDEPAAEGRRHLVGFVGADALRGREEERRRWKAAEARPQAKNPTIGGVPVSERVRYEGYVRAVRSASARLRSLPWYKKAAAGPKPNPIVLARAWIRCAVGVPDALNGYVSLLLHGVNRRVVLEGHYAPWSLLRSDKEDAAFKNALILMERMSKLHVVELPMADEDQVKAVADLPSQWWPLPFKCFKARQRFDEMYNPAKVSNNPPPPTPTVSSMADVEAKMKSMAVRVTEEYRSTTSVEEGMDKFADALDHGLAAAMSYYSGAAARPLGHTKFASSAPQATAQPRPPQLGAAAGGLFGTPLHLLSESTRHSSIKASYDPLLSPPTAIMSLLDAVEAGMDAPGLFHSGLSTPPPPHVLDAVERDGSVPPSDSAAVDAAAVLVHWLRCLPGSLVGNREALLAASNLDDEKERRRNVRLLLESSARPPADLIFVRLVSILAKATDAVHSRRNGLTVVRASLLFGPVVFGVPADEGQRRRNQSLETRESMDLRDSVETSEIFQRLLDDAEYFMEGMVREATSRQARLDANLEGLGMCLERRGRGLDVRLITKDGEDDEFVEGGGGEGEADLKLLEEFTSLLRSDEIATRVEGSDALVLEGVNVFNDVAGEITETSPLVILALFRLLKAYPNQARSVFGKFSKGAPSISQVCSQMLAVVLSAVGITKSHEDDPGAVPAPRCFPLLCSGSEEVGAEDILLELTTICWLTLNDNFVGGLAGVREGMDATLGLVNGPAHHARSLDDCWKGFVSWKETTLVKLAEAEAGVLAPLTKDASESKEYYVIPDSGSERGGLSIVAPPAKHAAPRFVKNSRLLDEKKLKLLSKNLPHYTQRREMLKIFDGSASDASLSKLYTCAEGHAYTVLLLKAETGKTFGGYADEQWRNHGDSYFGSSDCFVFSFETDRAGREQIAVHKQRQGKGGKSLSANDDFCGMGSGLGGTFALYLDCELSMGSSNASVTFGNPVSIAGSEEFVIEQLELWAFLI